STPGQFPTGGEHVCVAARQTQLSEVDRQTEGDIESKLILQEIAVSLNFKHRLIKICDRSHLQVAGPGFATQVVIENIDRRISRCGQSRSEDWHEVPGRIKI